MANSLSVMDQFEKVINDMDQYTFNECLIEYRKVLDDMHTRNLNQFKKADKFAGSGNIGMFVAWPVSWFNWYAWVAMILICMVVLLYGMLLVRKTENYPSFVEYIVGLKLHA